ncbi:MAG: hypothetical protein NT023_04550 [Armatimonadetes bacterium]|nr:hypothetical protein [Armatimonadota bacterium]
MTQRYWLKISSAVWVLALFGCRVQSPKENAQALPEPSNLTWGAIITEKGSQEDVSNVLPEGGALLFLCTCSSCRITVQSLEALLPAQTKLRQRIMGLTTMNPADNHRFSQETKASFRICTDSLNSMREKYKVSQCPRLICLSFSGVVVFDSGDSSQPIPVENIKKGLSLFGKAGDSIR